jgi:hypothetical protein
MNVLVVSGAYLDRICRSNILQPKKKSRVGPELGKTEKKAKKERGFRKITSVKGMKRKAKKKNRREGVKGKKVSRKKRERKKGIKCRKSVKGEGRTGERKERGRRV